MGSLSYSHKNKTAEAVLLSGLGGVGYFFTPTLSILTVNLHFVPHRVHTNVFRPLMNTTGLPQSHAVEGVLKIGSLFIGAQC